MLPATPFSDPSCQPKRPKPEYEPKKQSDFGWKALEEKPDYLLDPVATVTYTYDENSSLRSSCYATATGARKLSCCHKNRLQLSIRQWGGTLASITRITTLLIRQPGSGRTT